MGAFVLAPLPFTAVSTAQVATAPPANLAVDHPARVWRSANATAATIDIQGGGQAIDTIALIGGNLGPSDTMVVRFAATQAGLDSASPVITVPGYTGSKSATVTSKTIARFASRAFQFVRITVTSPSAKVFEAQRLVVGRAVTCSGLDYDAKMGVDDNSPATTGVNYSTYRRYSRLPGWRFTVTIENDDAWYDEWLPSLTEVGQSSPLLFVPDDENPRQNAIIFGRITARGEGTAEGVNWWSLALAVTAIAP